MANSSNPAFDPRTVNPVENLPRSSREPCFIPNYLLQGLDSKINCPSAMSFALQNAAHTLTLLSELFGGDAEAYKFPILEDKNARTGMFLQLEGVATLLRSCAKALAAKERTTEIAISLTVQDFLALGLLARNRGVSPEELARELVESRLATN